MERMIYWLSRQFDNDSILSVGAVSPLAFAAYLLAKRTHAPRLLILAANAGCVDPATRPALMSLAEAMDVQTALHWCGGDHAWYRYYLPGYISNEVVSSAQIDRFGRSNTIEIRTSKGMLRLPGQGGMAEVADLSDNLYFYLPRHSTRNLVEQVDFAGVARHLLTAQEREAVGLQPGEVKLVTNLAVFKVDHDTREFKIVSLHPGVTLAEVQEATGFPVHCEGDIPLTEEPDEESLRMIREEIDPLGLRFLESATGPDRQAMIDKILDAEEALIKAQGNFCESKVAN
jgi:glutaconate CoA-transferase subunit A